MCNLLLSECPTFGVCVHAFERVLGTSCDGCLAECRLRAQVNEAQLDQNTFSYTTPALDEGQFYRFILYAQNAVGWSSASNVYRVQICKPPDPPSDFLISEYTDTSIALAWSPPTDVGCLTPTGCGCYIESYALSLKLVTSSEYVEVYRGGPATLAYVRTGLATGSEYDFKITASNFMWESEQSSKLDSVSVRLAPATDSKQKASIQIHYLYGFHSPRSLVKLTCSSSGFTRAVARSET